MNGTKESKEQEKHEIAVLTELVLYKRIKSFDIDDKLDKQKKEKGKEEAIDLFVESCVESYKLLSPEEIKEHILYVLNRTIKNIERLNNQR